MVVLLVGAAGCVTAPDAVHLQEGVAAYPGGPIPAGLDGRARFREIFCARAAPAGDAPDGDPGCQSLLWRLNDEPPAATPRLPPRSRPNQYRIFVISGAFGDCRMEGLVPYRDAIDRLADDGVQIQALTVGGRSSPQHNSRQIAAAIRAAGPNDAEPFILLGYSKGTVDILQFLVDEPALAGTVAAVLSVAGPVFGSPLAAQADWWYRTFMMNAFSSFCDAGDGGMVQGLLPEERSRWLETHPLPASVRYFSLAAFPSREHLSRALQLPWKMLARTDPRNDGQVIAADTIIPGATLLGYANADHWDLALALDEQLPFWSSRPSKRRFPRDALFDAMLMYVYEALEPASPNITRNPHRQ